MKEKAEIFVLGVIKGYQKLESLLEGYRALMEKQVEVETGMNKEFVVLCLKLQFISILPNNWQVRAYRFFNV